MAKKKVLVGRHRYSIVISEQFYVNFQLAVNNEANNEKI